MKTQRTYSMTSTWSHAREVSLAAVAALLVATVAGSAVLAAEETVAPSATSSDEPAEQAAEPRFWSDVLVAGDCIIRPPVGTLPEPISCDQLHGEEIYAVGRLDLGPDAPYPGDAISDMVGEQLCDTASVDFGGATWDLLPFATFWLFPLEFEWEAGDRGIMCAAGPPDDTPLKIGTAGGGTLESEDALLARGEFIDPELGQFEEWVVVEQDATVSSAMTIGDGAFDLQLRRPWAVPQGFMFHALDRSDPGFATTTWGYAWATGEFTDLGSVFPGWELASTMIMNDNMVVAGRRTPDDDWDLFASIGPGDVLPLADGPGNQHFPTFTPDGTQVVFHDDGDLVVIDVDGSNRRVLVERPSSAFESAVSPDGTKVAFASDHDGNDDIWLVDFEGGEPVNLTQHPANEAWPVWSPNGSSIYFQSDRLRPENNVSSLMMMNADGSEPSWFSGTSLGQALVLDREVVDDALPDLLTIDERYSYEPIEGDPGTTQPWEHSSGRLAVDLPAGWRVAEFDADTGFLAAPRPSHYEDSWAADGVSVTLHERLTRDEFFELVDETAAVQSCERFDGSDGIEPISDIIDGLALNHECGDEGAVAGVIALYNNATSVGVLIEGQRDNLPDVETDKATLDAIAASLAWE